MDENFSNIDYCLKTTEKLQYYNIPKLMYYLFDYLKVFCKSVALRFSIRKPQKLLNTNLNANLIKFYERIKHTEKEPLSEK